MNLRNIQRDMTWLTRDKVTLSSTGSHATPLANTPNSGAVSTVQASVGFTSQTTVAGVTTLGVALRGPQVDDEPYRVKMGIRGTRSGGGNITGFRGGIIVGTLPASPTGTDDIVSNPVFIPTYDFDDILLMPIYDGETGLPLYIGCYFADSADIVMDGYISVQRLSIAPPTYTSHVV